MIVVFAYTEPPTSITREKPFQGVHHLSIYPDDALEQAEADVAESAELNPGWSFAVMPGIEQPFHLNR